MHIMTPKSRAYYDLESFWSNGAPVPLEGVLTPNVPEQQQQQEGAVVEEVVSQAVCCMCTYEYVCTACVAAVMGMCDEVVCFAFLGVFFCYTSRCFGGS